MLQTHYLEKVVYPINPLDLLKKPTYIYITPNGVDLPHVESKQNTLKYLKQIQDSIIKYLENCRTAVNFHQLTLPLKPPPSSCLESGTDS